MIGVLVSIGIGGVFFFLIRNGSLFASKSRSHTLLRGGSDHGDDDDSHSTNTNDHQIVFDDFISSSKSNNSFFQSINNQTKSQSKYQLAPGIEIGPMHQQYRDDDDEDDILEITL